MGGVSKKRHIPGGNVRNCDIKVKRYVVFCERKYVVFWGIERSWWGGDVVLAHKRRHKCGEEGKFRGGLDPTKLADKKGSEGGSIGLGGPKVCWGIPPCSEVRN